MSKEAVSCLSIFEIGCFALKIKNLGNLVSGILLVVQFVLEAVVAILIGRLGMLPGGLFAAFIAVLVLGMLVPTLLMWKRKKGKHESSKPFLRRIIGWILSAVVIAVCIAGTWVLAKAYSTMSSVTNSTVSAVVGIYVRKDDPAQSFDDASNYVFGVTPAYDTENTQKTINELQDQFGKTLNTKNFDTVFAMVDALYNGDVGAIILNSAYVGVLEGFEAYQNFEEWTRLLLDHSVVIEVVIPTPDPDQNADDLPEWYQKPQSAEDPFVIYLSGSDTRSNQLTTSRSDVNILAVVNPKTAQILLVNTPRDYYVANPVGNGALDKLTHCGIYGVECSMAALSQLYEVPVHYSAQVNFSGFRTLINAIGGITVYSDVAFTTRDGYWIQQGENYMDGAKALSFARERYALAGGDNDRGSNQMKVIAAVVDKLSAGTIVSNYSQIMDSMQGMFATNMTTDEIMGLVKFQISNMPDWNLVSYAVTGDHGFDETFSAPGMSLYVMIPNDTTVEKASQLMQRVLNGEALTASDVAP